MVTGAGGGIRGHPPSMQTRLQFGFDLASSTRPSGELFIR